jgi:hypothetical protein
MGASVNPHVQFTNPASDPRGRHSDPSGNVPLYLKSLSHHKRIPRSNLHLVRHTLCSTLVASLSRFGPCPKPKACPQMWTLSQRPSIWSKRYHEYTSYKLRNRKLHQTHVLWRSNHCKAIMRKKMQVYLCLVFYLVGYHRFEHVHHPMSLNGSCTLIGSSCILLLYHLLDCP